jgi:predicted MFS family arabinose efflux permease
VVLLGFSAAAFVPTLQAAISEQVPFYRRGRILGIVEFSWALTGLVILPLVGLLMVQRGWQAPLRVVALLSLAAAPLPVLFPRRQRHLAQLQRSLRQAAGVVWRTTSARANIVVTGLIFVAAEAFFVTYGAWLEQAFGMAPNQIGRVASVLGLAELTASAASSLFIDRLGKRRGVGLGVVAMTLTMALLPLLERWQSLAIAGMAIFTIAFEFSIVSNIGLLSEQVPQARGTVLAMAAMAGGVTRTLTDTLGVALFEWRGMQATAAYGMAGAALAAFVLFRWVKEHGEMAEMPEGAIDGG